MERWPCMRVRDFMDGVELKVVGKGRHGYMKKKKKKSQVFMCKKYVWVTV